MSAPPSSLFVLSLKVLLKMSGPSEMRKQCHLEKCSHGQEGGKIAVMLHLLAFPGSLQIRYHCVSQQS